MQNAAEILWTSGFFNERFPAPVSPLGWSHIAPAIEAIALRDPLRFLGYPDAAKIPLTRLWRGHPYTNARAFQIFYKVFPDLILPEDAYRYFPDGDVALRRHAPYPRWIDAPRFVFSLLRAFFADPFNVSPLHNHAHWARYTRQHDARVAALRAQSAALAGADSRDIFAALRDAENLHRDFLRIHRWSLMDADLTFGLLKRLIAAWIDPARAAELAARLVADVPNKTRVVDAALRALTDDQSSMSAFLAEHGHRSFSLDLAAPTFADDPTQVERLRSNNNRNAEKPGEKNPPASLRLPAGVRGVVFAWLLDLTRRYMGMREDQRYYWQKSLAVARQLYLMLAARLVADGVIAERDAVFYATHQELADYFAARMARRGLTHTIAARQAEWREYQREFAQSPTTAYPAFLRGDTPVTNARQNISRAPISVEWRGRAISPGIARGLARVIASATELARVLPGEILVAPATDPAWTPVFARIAGLVVERGGVLSHSAVVAREYHIPAVAGIAHIVAEIQNGERLEVDGSQGIVRRIVKSSDHLSRQDAPTI